MVHSPSSIEQKQKIRDVKFDYLFSHMPKVIFANLVISSTMVFILWEAYPRNYLVSWLVAIYLLTIIRVPVVFYFHKKFNHRNKRTIMEIVFIVFSFLSGCIWSVAGILFVDPQYTIQTTIVILVLMGMMSGAVASLSAIYSVYLAFSLVVWLPVTIHLLMIGTAEYYVLGGMALFYLLLYVSQTWSVSKLVEKSISLQFDNLGLIEELREQKNLAEQANTDKSRFLAAASHDLRQPLHTLNLFVDTLDKRLANKENREILNFIMRSVGALGDLFNKLLDISKLDAGFVDVSKNNIKLQPIVDKVVADFKPVLSEKDLSLSNVKTSLVIVSDPVYLELILRNLIGNAIQYTDKGKILIGCRRRLKKGEVDIQIIDTGYGIPKEEIDKVFTEFYQIGNPERDRSKGHGLGLSIVKRLVSLLNHQLSIQSEIDKGSQFGVSLKLGDINKISEQPAPYTIQNTCSNLQGLKILAIDDEKAILKALEGVVTSWGCTINTAESLVEALPVFNSDLPDILLVDYRLRENKSGLEAIEELQQRCDNPLPAILITGDTGIEHLKKTKASGLMVLHKPVRPAQLRMAITETLQKFKLVSQEG